MTRTYPSASAQNVAYRYDEPAATYGIGRLTGWNDPSGTTSLVYDARGNVIQSTRTIGGLSYVTQYGWTLADLPASITYPGGRVIDYTRDALGRVTTVTQRDTIVGTPRTVVDTVTWQPFGPLAGLRYANAIGVTLTWDLDWRVSRILAATTGTTFLDLGYTWDNADNVSAIADARVPARTQGFGYDVLDRLTSATGAYGAWTYGYSANGNRTARDRTGGPSETYTTTSGTNRLASVADGTVTRTFGYDGAGAVTGDDRGPGQAFTYLYDRAGRMVEVQRSSQIQARYSLNALGERVVKTHPGSPDQVTHFHYDLNGRLIAETDGSGAVLRAYIWLDDLPVMARIGSGEYAILADHLGTPHRPVDGSGTVVWDAVWRPFGEIDSLTATVSFPLRLPGQYFDAETGLHYNYQRDYDAALGRYIQADPIGLSGGSNRYAYADGNPLGFTDPSGTITLTHEYVLWLLKKRPRPGTETCPARPDWPPSVMKSEGEKRPPPGSKGIDKTPWSGDHGKIKESLGLGGRDDVLIDPDGNVWVKHPDGSYTNEGPASDYTGSGKPSGRKGKDRDRINR